MPGGKFGNDPYEWYTSSGGGNIDERSFAGMSNPIEAAQSFVSDVQREFSGIAESEPGQIAGRALENAMNAVTSAEDLPSGIAAGAGELAKGGAALAGNFGEFLGGEFRKQGESLVKHAGEAITENAPGIAEGIKSGIEDIGEKAIEALGLEEYMPDIKTGLEGLGKAAGLGALNEIWSATTGAASHPISTTANTIEQLMNIDNKRSI